MFNKLGLLAIVSPLVSALTLNVPSNLVSSGPATFTWTSTSTDLPFSLELVNDDFHRTFAIANNVDPAQGSLTLTLPSVPVGGGYQVEAVDPGNINNVFSQTGEFSIGENPDSTSSPSQVSTSATGTSLPATATASVTAKTSPSVAASGVSSAHTVSAQTVTSPSGSATATGSASSTAQSNAAAAPTINGASNYKFGGSKGAMAAVLISAVAGAAVVVL